MVFFVFFFECYGDHRELHVLTHSFPTRRSSDLLCLFWEFYRFEEVRVDVGEIHLAHVETRKFVDRKTRTLLFLGLAPRLVDLRAALLLKDPRELDRKSVV